MTMCGALGLIFKTTLFIYLHVSLQFLMPEWCCNLGVRRASGIDFMMARFEAPDMLESNPEPVQRPEEMFSTSSCKLNQRMREASN